MATEARVGAEEERLNRRKHVIAGNASSGVVEGERLNRINHLHHMYATSVVLGKNETGSRLTLVLF